MASTIRVCWGRWNGDARAAVQDGQCVVTRVSYYQEGHSQEVRRYLVRNADGTGQEYMVENTLTMNSGEVHARTARFVPVPEQ